MRYGELVEIVLLTLVFASSVFVVGRRRSIGSGGGKPDGACAAGQVFGALGWPGFSPVGLSAFRVCFVGFVIIHLVHSTLEARKVDANVLCAAISAYLMLGLLCTMAYSSRGRFSPDAFAFSTGEESSRTMSRFNAFYFSFATLSTVGYGDIAPVSKGGAHARGVRGDDRHALRRGADCPARVALLGTQSATIRPRMKRLPPTRLLVFFAGVSSADFRP